MVPFLVAREDGEVILELLPPLGVDLAGVEFNPEDRLDAGLLRSLFELRV
jgi:hypothetical protein